MLLTLQVTDTRSHRVTAELLFILQKYIIKYSNLQTANPAGLTMNCRLAKKASIDNLFQHCYLKNVIQLAYLGFQSYSKCKNIN